MYFLISIIGTAVIAGIVGYASERSGFTRNGALPSIIIAVGGAILFFFTKFMFGISFGSPGVDAIIASVGALVIVPTHWRK
ncbi:hypothetical protein [Actibacterium pelagium]|uniref:Transglycosylase associated protein n=1 Tax=Actibacterium pelagium TaxID=2029103 RepID=A0A917AG67_9RHOB|nr:hypothetical protein [Actibacterium pelagium]GGE49489.1 hypothetical protein GCM10011517_16620 [Actibacterium pelagium]